MITISGKSYNSWMFNKTEGVNSFLVSTSDLKKGIYLLHIMFGDMRETKKVIIK